jgi:nucleotide-binding universal stress UspA family protein
MRVSGALAGEAVAEPIPWYHQKSTSHMARFGEGGTMMHTTILLAAALQNWDRYSAHALAAREVAATLAKGAAHHLHVLSVYDPPSIDTGDLPAEIATRHREDLLLRTDALMVEKLDEYVAPLKAEGLEVTSILRTGDPREVIVQVATSLKADLLILGSHSKRGLLDIVLGGTAQQVSKSAPCLVVLVSPKKEEGG